MERLLIIIDYLNAVEHRKIDRKRCLLLELLKISPGSITVERRQVEILKQLQSRGELLLNKMNPTEWTRIMWEDKHCILFEEHFDGINLQKNQMERATALVAEMKSQGLRRLRTMDGHGRFLACFFRALQIAGESVNDYEIEIYDTDLYTNEWHVLLFPSNIIAYNEDIMDELDGIVEHSGATRNTMLYLNFCSLGTQTYKVLEFINSVLNEYHVPGIMLSYSRRNLRRTGALYDAAITLLKKYDSSLICTRGLFISTFVRPLLKSTSVSDTCEVSGVKRRKIA